MEPCCRVVRAKLDRLARRHVAAQEVAQQRAIAHLHANAGRDFGKWRQRRRRIVGTGQRVSFGIFEAENRNRPKPDQSGRFCILTLRILAGAFGEARPKDGNCLGTLANVSACFLPLLETARVVRALAEHQNAIAKRPAGARRVRLCRKDGLRDKGR